ncbi:MAG TPA: hypothetical protein VGA98_10840 [Allosphingosinicella sp.]|jgi:hypothetical protein
MRRPLFGFVSALAAVAASPAAATQAAAPPPAAEGSGRAARLSALLGAGDHMALGRMIREPITEADVMTDLDWLKERLFEGRSAWIAMLYAKLLWSLSDSSPPEAADELRQTAVMATLYASAAIAIDGARCGDRSAPASRQDQVMGWEPEIWPFLAKMTPEHRERAIQLAALIEERTRTRRDSAGDVEFLCRGGMEEMQYNMKHGSMREVAPRPGQIGRQIVVDGDGKYRPSVREEKAWRPEAEAARSGLRARLMQLVAAVTGPPSP